MIDRSRIGFTTEPTTVSADGWRVKLFCQAIGETDPVYRDPAVALAAGHPACPLPPTFLKALEGEHFSGGDEPANHPRAQRADARMSTALLPSQLELRCGPVTAIDLALFAAASGDHNPLHLDIETARAAGFDKPVVHGMLTMAYAGRLLSQHFGAGSVRALQTRFTGVAKLGDVIVLDATLTGADGGEAHYTLRAHTADGAELMSGQARVAAAAAP